MTAQAKTPIEVLKGLRETHAATFAKTQDLLKSQKQAQQGISKAIQEQAKTVPAIAAETGLPSRSVLWWLASMKKYGLVVEDGMEDDYPLYKLVEEKK